MHFKYAAEEPDGALRAIESHLRDEIHDHGGMPSWLGLSQGSVWLVKGRPWREVSPLCHRFVLTFSRQLHSRI